MAMSGFRRDAHRDAPRDHYRRRSPPPSPYRRRVSRSRSRERYRSRSRSRSHSPYRSRSRSPYRRRRYSRSPSPRRPYPPPPSQHYRRRSPPPPARPRRTREVIRGSDEERQRTSSLFIGNLPYSFEERDVVNLMERFGALRMVSVPLDRYTRRNRGFAFVEFEQRADAEDAYNKYKDYDLEGRKLRVDWDIGRAAKDTIRGVPNSPPRGEEGMAAGILFDDRIITNATCKGGAPVLCRPQSRSPSRSRSRSPGV